ncbi:MAG: prolipoprotein diacylglyceryl transferase [Clostridiales Family XIII bacterium]|jgi:phosphatidylglycerol:prolipoprotein diacylglycerol transferase|nr:prolipoprotein diacylglyceryl transferase [Clostridiales Family XIII bacterium]
MPSPPERVAFSVFGIDIMWYAIIVVAALLVGVVVVCGRARRYGYKTDTVIDFMLFCIPAGIVGARLYYVLFNLEYFSQEPLQVFNTRAGGLAIHGGLILGILVALLLCRLWDIPPLKALDIAAPAFALAQAIGRWGNYFNQEAHGGPTELPWGMIVGGEKVHPTFLYESLWCLLLFLLLSRIDRRRGFSGRIFLLYCILYSFERFFVEQLRTDSLMLFGEIRQAQALSAAVFVVCLVAYFILRHKDRRHGAMYY